MTEGSRQRAGVAVVAVLAILASANSCQVSSANARQFPDSYGVEAAKRRFEPAQSRLPVTRVAYISDLPLSGNAGTTAFLAAQYALAPRILVPAGPDMNAEWAVGNFARPGDFAAMGAAFGYALIDRFDAGVVLFRRPKP